MDATPPLPLKQSTAASSPTAAATPAASSTKEAAHPFALLCPRHDEAGNPFTKPIALAAKTSEEARLALLQFCICYDPESIATIPKLLSTNVHEPAKSIATFRRLMNQVPLPKEALSALRVCPRTLLTTYYLAVAPQMVPNVSTVLQKAYGHEEDLWPMLLKKYGPMPPPWELFKDWEERQKEEEMKAKQHQQRLQEYQSRGMTRLRNLRRAQSFSPEDADMFGREENADDFDDLLLEANVDGKRRVYRRDRQQMQDDVIRNHLGTFDDDYEFNDDPLSDGGSMQSDPSFALFSPSSFNMGSPSFAASSQRSFARRNTQAPATTSQPVAEPSKEQALGEDEAERVLRLFNLDPKALVDASMQLATSPPAAARGGPLADLEVGSQQSGGGGEVASEGSFSWAGSFVSSPRQMRRRVSFTDAVPTTPTNADGKMDSLLVRQSSIVKASQPILPRRRTMVAGAGDLSVVSAEDMSRL